eukprot:1353961-Prymnesium_polylepis.1
MSRRARQQERARLGGTACDAARKAAAARGAATTRRTAAVAIEYSTTSRLRKPSESLLTLDFFIPGRVYVVGSYAAHSLATEQNTNTPPCPSLSAVF